MRDIAVTLAVVGLNAVLLLRHRLWRDEIQSWAIAHTSHSLDRMIDLLRNEGHPPLWYMVLWPFAHLNASPWSMQVVGLACVGATALIVLRNAPWRWWIRVLFLLGYFTAFEYAVMARAYTLTLPLVMGLCAVGWSARRRNWLLVGVLASLVGVTSVYGLWVAAAILAGLLVDEWQSRRGNVQWFDWRGVGGGVLLFVIVQIVTYVAVWPRPVVTARTVSRGPFHALGLAGANLSRSFWPIPDVRTAFWESNAIVVHVGMAVLGLLGVISVLAVIWVLRVSLPAVVTWLVGISLVGGFSGLTGQGAMLFSGHMLLALVAAFWAAGSTRAVSTDASKSSVASAASRDTLLGRWLAPARRLTTVFVGLLAIQTAALAFVLPQAASRPFSNLEPAASRLKQLPATTLISADPEQIGGALGALMHRPVFQVESGATATYTVWGMEKRCGEPGPPLRCFGDETVISRTRRAASGREAVLVTSRPLRPMPGVHQLWSMTGAVVPTEDLWAYEVSPLHLGGAS